MILLKILVSTVVYAIIYNLGALTSTKIDNGTKAYILNVYNDSFNSIISPLLLMFWAPSIRKKVEGFLKCFKRSNKVDKVKKITINQSN